MAWIYEVSIEDSDPYLEIAAKHPAALQIFGEAGKASQRVARQDATEGSNSLLLARELRRTVWTQADDNGIDVFGFSDSGAV